MKTIKIIDLLNKIANREEVPKKIEYEGEIYEFNKNIHGYWGGKNKDCFRAMVNWRYLNNEVEILDKIEEKKIPEKLEKYYDENLKGWQINKYGETISKEEINQLMEYIKKLRNILFNHIEYDNEDKKKQINFFGYSNKEDEEFEILKELLESEDE